VGDRVDTAPCVLNKCAVDGEWSGWTPWGYCDRTCGNGTRIRTRRCDSPAPEFGGKECIGGDDVETESENCSVRECDPVDGAWTVWSREEDSTNFTRFFCCCFTQTTCCLQPIMKLARKALNQLCFQTSPHSTILSKYGHNKLAMTPLHLHAPSRLTQNNFVSNTEK
jgi:hypothetical protein